MSGKFSLASKSPAPRPTRTPVAATMPPHPEETTGGAGSHSPVPWVLSADVKEPLPAGAGWHKPTPLNKQPFSIRVPVTGQGAVNALTMAIAAELKAHGVRANVVCPGARTRLSTGAEYENHIRDLHRRGLLDEVTMRASLDSAPAAFAAPIYPYLASDLARDLTGRIFVAAGGFIGSFDRPTPRLLGYRDHQHAEPSSVHELHQMIGAAPWRVARRRRSRAGSRR